jgi:hypothetical protein
MALQSNVQPEENPKLLARLRKLEAENIYLREEVEFLRSNPTLAKGLKGESLIAKLVSAQYARKGAGHDLESHANQLLFEVKYSSLLTVVKNYPIKRWVWTKLFGESGSKNYDHLLLVGDADPRFTASYNDPASPYVIFDLPYDVAVEIAGGVRAGRAGRIQLTTNPASVRSPRALDLFRNYQISVSELQHRYPNLETVA